MPKTSVYDLDIEALNPSRRRLYEEHTKLRSWLKVAQKRRVNFRYVYEYAINNKVPRNYIIWQRLGIKRTVTINQLLKLPLQEMPTDILRLAFLKREEYLP